MPKSSWSTPRRRAGHPRRATRLERNLRALRPRLAAVHGERHRHARAQPRRQRPAHQVASNRVTEPFLTLLIEATWARGRLCANTPCCSIRRCSRRAEAPAPVARRRRARSRARSAQVAQQPPAEIPRRRRLRVRHLRADAGAGRSASRPAAARRRVTKCSAATPSRRSQRRLSASTRRAKSLDGRHLSRQHGAFEGDMNSLRAGAVLRIPGATKIAAISTGRSHRAKYAAIAGWRGRAPSQVAQEAAGRLRLVAPSDRRVEPVVGDIGEAEQVAQSAFASSKASSTNRKRMLELRNTGAAAELQAAGRRPSSRRRRRSAGRGRAATRDDPLRSRADGAPAEARRRSPPPTETPPPPSARARPPAAAPAEGGRSLLDTLKDYWWVLALGAARAAPRPAGAHRRAASRSRRIRRQSRPASPSSAKTA